MHKCIYNKKNYKFFNSFIIKLLKSLQDGTLLKPVWMNCSYTFKRSPFHIVFRFWLVQVNTSCYTVMKNLIPCKILHKILRNQIILSKQKLKYIYVVNFYSLNLTS